MHLLLFATLSHKATAQRAMHAGKFGVTRTSKERVKKKEERKGTRRQKGILKKFKKETLEWKSKSEIEKYSRVSRAKNFFTRVYCESVSFNLHESYTKKSFKFFARNYFFRHTPENHSRMYKRLYGKNLSFFSFFSLVWFRCAASESVLLSTNVFIRARIYVGSLYSSLMIYEYLGGNKYGSK